MPCSHYAILFVQGMWVIAKAIFLHQSLREAVVTAKISSQYASEDWRGREMGTRLGGKKGTCRGSSLGPPQNMCMNIQFNSIQGCSSSSKNVPECRHWLLVLVHQVLIWHQRPLREVQGTQGCPNPSCWPTECCKPKLQRGRAVAAVGAAAVGAVGEDGMSLPSAASGTSSSSASLQFSAFCWGLEQRNCTMCLIFWAALDWLHCEAD